MQPIEQINKETIFIVSAELSRLTPKQNEAATNDLDYFLKRKNIPHKVLLWQHNGIEETSFLIVGDKYEQLVLTISNIFGQSCYFKSLPSRESYLIGVNGNIESIGKLTAITKEEVEQLGNWSYCFDLKQYYTTRKD